MLKKNASKEKVIEQIRAKTEELVSSVPGGIYSDDIRRQQLIEIDLLIDHYSRLLNAVGQDYAALVTHVYQTADSYASFLKALGTAEKDVISAARRTLGSQTDMAAAEKIESITENMRAAEVNKIFPSSAQPQDVE
jgi:hypothetical protein